jgi:putative sporulation protein YtaF
VVIGVSMQVGVLLAKVVSPHAASEVGAVILVLMGCWSLVQMMMQKEKGHNEKEVSTVVDLPQTENREAEKPAVYSLELRQLGIVIQILRTPSSADMDDSGSISSMEAMILGIALSLDAFGAGLGAALLGFNPVWTALAIALFSGTFLVMGMRTGFRFAGSNWMKHAAVLPALMLIIMGIMKLL